MKNMNPVQLQKWANENEPDKMLWKNGYWNQIKFIRDYVPRIFLPKEDINIYEKYMLIQESIMVISTHFSKSIELPVYRFIIKDVTFVVRYNFYNWKISIDSPFDINADFMNIFNSDINHNQIYCEGFPPDLIFKSFSESKKRFTIELSDNYKVYTFFWIFNNYIREKINYIETERL